MSDWVRADRIGKMLLGILLIGMCVAAYRISLFGVDAFSCMNLGISGFLGISFGTWQLIMNAAVLIVVFLQCGKYRTRNNCKYGLCGVYCRSALLDRT